MPARKTNCCLMPDPISEPERDLWKALHTLKCDRKRESHQCRGTITITATDVTLQCPVCGDSRSTL